VFIWFDLGSFWTKEYSVSDNDDRIDPGDTSLMGRTGQTVIGRPEISMYNFGGGESGKNIARTMVEDAYHGENWHFWVSKDLTMLHWMVSFIESFALVNSLESPIMLGFGVVALWRNSTGGTSTPKLGEREMFVVDQ